MKEPLRGYRGIPASCLNRAYMRSVAYDSKELASLTIALEEGGSAIISLGSGLKAVSRFCI
jgi:hypothetical protein